MGPEVNPNKIVTVCEYLLCIVPRSKSVYVWFLEVTPISEVPGSEPQHGISGECVKKNSAISTTGHTIHPQQHNSQINHHKTKDNLIIL